MCRLRIPSLFWGSWALFAGLVSTSVAAQQAATDAPWFSADSTSSSLPVEGRVQDSVIQRLLRGPLVESRVVRNGAGGSLHADAVLQIDPQSNLALLCAQGIGVAGSLGRIGQRCLLGQLESRNDLPGYGQGVGVSGAWLSENRSIDLRFGLSWLDELDHSHVQPVSAAHQLFQTSLQDQATPFSWDTLRLAGTTLQIGSVVEFGESGWFRVGGSQSWLESRSDSFLQLPQRMNVEVLQLDIGLGQLSAGIRGSQMQLGSGSIKGMDVGVTWRTPWQGELSVGATQYWSRGNTEQWPLRELPVAEETSGRVPYVRYHQDL